LHDWQQPWVSLFLQSKQEKWAMRFRFEQIVRPR
jgi:hypothetical protein